MPIRIGAFLSRYALIVHKDRPDWQKGRLNLVGGKVESGETPEQAALRELKEESGLTAMPGTHPALCGRIVTHDSVIHCLRCHLGGVTTLQPRDGETERVEWLHFSNIKNNPKLMPNLRVIIPLLMMDSRGWTINDYNESMDAENYIIEISLKKS